VGPQETLWDHIKMMSLKDIKHKIKRDISEVFGKAAYDSGKTDNPSFTVPTELEGGKETRPKNVYVRFISNSKFGFLFTHRRKRTRRGEKVEQLC